MFMKTFELPLWSEIQIRLCMASNQRFNEHQRSTNLNCLLNCVTYEKIFNMSQKSIKQKNDSITINLKRVINSLLEVVFEVRNS